MEEDLVFIIAKHIAEADSIGEGYGYCSEYDLEMFKSENLLPRWNTGKHFNTYREAAESLLEKIKQYHMETAF